MIVKSEEDFKRLPETGHLKYKPDKLYELSANLTVFTSPEKEGLTRLSKFPKLPHSSYHIDPSTSSLSLLSILLGQYSYKPYAEPSPPITFSLSSPPPPSLSPLLTSIFASKTLINSPPNLLNPTIFTAITSNLLPGPWKEIVGPELSLKFKATSAVGSASLHQPRILKYRHVGEGPLFTIIGKSVTFDSGGLSLKPSDSMINMKKDMGGGAIATGLCMLLKASNFNFELILPVVENMINGEAYRLGDVIEHDNGLTTEVLNTDAEGRLILSDALCWAEGGDGYVIDFATLTGAARVALGVEVGMYFTDDDELGERIYRKGLEVKDPVWRMPLYEGYEKRLKGKISDLTNVTRDGGLGGAITAALYLKNFVPEKKKWVHFDVNGMDEHGMGEANGLRACWEVIKEIVKEEKNRK
ncbi:hypothetical protein TrST_g12050 [Triparma strigata]|uniref:Cytosol aminopeptidase domain-containing protein n=1 Tax=Triparma strigata TaxID=1606541 RepID=A0A9W7A8F2_9STRA|nr:hypothetical protein TrST_g12050 [Triparma strigata]